MIPSSFFKAKLQQQQKVWNELNLRANNIFLKGFVIIYFHKLILF